MTKIYYAYSDRTVRYINRCNQKFKRDTHLEIKKKNEEIKILSRENTNNINRYKRTLLMADLNFNNYQNLYITYANTIRAGDFVFENLQRANTYLREENTRLREKCLFPYVLKRSKSI